MKENYRLIFLLAIEIVRLIRLVFSMFRYF
jgi:hypothetical protein